jgi:hypothetical protein
VSVRFLTQTAAFGVLLLVTASAGEAQYSQGTEVNTTVETNLDQGRFRQPLPFDVPFYVAAPIENDVAEVQGKYARRHDMTCEVALSGILTQPSLSTFAAPPPPPPVPPVAPVVGGVSVAPVNAAAAAAAAAAAKKVPPARGSIPGWLGYANLFVNDMGVRLFELSVPPLKPRKDYCFQFVVRKKTDPVTARAIVATALDQELREVPDTVAITRTEDYEAFRQRVLNEIDRKLVEKQNESPQFRLVLEVPDNSFFNGTVPTSDIGLTYRTQFTRVVQAQRNKAEAASDFTANATVAAGVLGGLATQASTIALMSALRASSTDPLIAPRLSALGSILELGTANLSSFALGMSNEIPDSLLDYTTTWNPAVADARVQVLDARIKELAELRQLAILLAADRGLRTIAGVEPAAAGAAANPNALLPADLNTVANLARQAVNFVTSARADAVDLRDALLERTAAIVAMAEQVGADLERVVRFTGTTTADWRTRATAYMSADVGLAYSKGIQSFFFYLGANIYLGPVNKKATLSLREDGVRSSIRKRLAVMFGIPMNPFEETQQTNSLNDPRGIELKGVIGSRPVLFGAGIRLTELVRFTAGTVIFKVRDPNPLVVDERLRRSAFFSISVDWDLRGSFGALVGTKPPTP